ncbi:hypothetical protein RHSIM_Rhsim07G0249000 [Rhododendron simsii]|uniref:Uncharacterized protein n=1 Tax=Rhododendron simsii TaxID=118357 RepID=A0A834GQY1_RHOSS|nr:hypothetical protein RHSIM_Rhsim07G0249000 [Rhododendron simsii]
MEVCACPNILLRAWSSSDFPCGVSGDRQRRIEYISSVVSALLSNLFYASLISLFGVGAMTALIGAVLGLKSKTGLLHGAAAGAYFYLLFFKASAGLWTSFADGPLSFLQLIVVISRLVNPALLYLGELIGPVGNQDVEDQMGTVQSINEVQRSISTRGAKEPSRRSVDGLSKTRTTDQNIYDDLGNRISCPICLEVEILQSDSPRFSN